MGPVEDRSRGSDDERTADKAAGDGRDARSPGTTGRARWPASHAGSEIQYAPKDHPRSLDTRDLQGTTNPKGNHWDNAVAEFLFAALKHVLVHP